MRLFSVQVSFPDTGNQAKEHLQVAVTDADQIPLAGDANLTKGDDVFIFLERLDNSDFGIANVTGEFFYVVVGGRQGVLRESSPGVWEQPRDPHEVRFGAEDGPTAVLSVALSELQRVATP